MLVYVAGLVCVALSWRARAPREAGHGEYHSMLLGSITGMVLLAEASDLITLFVGLELLSIPLYVLCATELRRRTSLEAGLKYLVIGSVGSATLLYGLAMVYGATGAMQFGSIASTISGRHDRPDRPAAPNRHRAGRHRARVQGLGRAVPPVDARRVRGRADADHHVHGGRHQGGRVRRDAEVLRPGGRAGAAGLGPGVRGACDGDDRDRQRRRDRAAVAQTAARLVERGPGRLPAGRAGGRLEARPAGDGLLRRRLPVHERGGVRGRGRARAGVRARRRPVLVREPRPDPALAGVADDDRDAVAGRRAGHGRLHREVLFDRRGGRRRLRVARRRDRDRRGRVVLRTTCAWWP